MEDTHKLTSIQKAQAARPFASYENVGRPTLMTPESIAKLEEIFLIGGTDEEACLFANISKTTLYNYQQDHPEFVERKEALKETPFIKARQTIIKSLDNPADAQWYLSRKKKREFGNNVDLTTNGEKLPTPLLNIDELLQDNSPQKDSEVIKEN